VVCGPEDTCQNGVCNADATNASCSSRGTKHRPVYLDSCQVASPVMPLCFSHTWVKCIAADCGSGQTCNTAGECTAPVPQQGACTTSGQSQRYGHRLHTQPTIVVVLTSTHRTCPLFMETTCSNMTKKPFFFSGLQTIVLSIATVGKLGFVN